jgi:hypothetical protein
MFLSWLLLAHARTSTFHAGPAMRSSYIGSAAFLATVWLIYPVAWACSEGANIIGISGEMIWYGVLDILSGPVFLFFFLHRLRGIDYGTLGLMSGKSTDYYGGAYGAGAGEKGLGHSGPGVPGVGAGTTTAATGPSAASGTGAPITGGHHTMGTKGSHHV